MAIFNDKQCSDGKVENIFSLGETESGLLVQKLLILRSSQKDLHNEFRNFDKNINKNLKRYIRFDTHV